VTSFPGIIDCAATDAASCD